MNKELFVISYNYVNRLRIDLNGLILNSFEQDPERDLLYSTSKNTVH